MGEAKQRRKLMTLDWRQEAPYVWALFRVDGSKRKQACYIILAHTGKWWLYDQEVKISEHDSEGKARLAGEQYESMTRGAP